MPVATPMRPPHDAAAAALGDFVARCAWSDLPEPVAHEAKRALLNLLGCALGVARTEPVEQAVAVQRRFGGPASATLIGRADRLDPPGASFVNAVAGNLLDFDDTHLNTVIHPSAPVAPPALALGELRGIGGQDVLLAFALGAEIACRVGNAVSPGHYARGWHITSTCGVFGAAAACARLLGLSAGQTGHALGIAASQSAGIVENLPTAAKNVSVGSAARNGLFAAMMAEAGYAAAPLAIEGPLGWARAMGDEPDVARMLQGLGAEWELLTNTYKPYPSGIVLHAVSDACLALRREHGIAAEAVSEVVVHGDALLLARGDRPVHTERDARVSIHHTAAVAFLFGATGVREYGPEAVANPLVAAFRGRVRAALAPDLPRGAARVEVVLQDGRRLTATVLHARGSMAAPLSDRDIEDKVRALAADAAPGVDLEMAIERCWRLDELEHIGDLLRHWTSAAA
ncbi:MAG TPA: MmgE/PrpD family protein [Acetobacteraceae bacterium]|nr:MmgE/PrpD family protein [Acetobacteraceae bacterium]